MPVGIVSAGRRPEQSVEVMPMPPEEAAEREPMPQRIYASRATLTQGTHWVSTTNTAYDGTYRMLSGAERKAAAQSRASRPTAAPAVQATIFAGYGGDGGGDEAVGVEAAAHKPAAGGMGERRAPFSKLYGR